MPEELEVPTEHLHEQVHEATGSHAAHAAPERWTLLLAMGTAVMAVFAAIAAMNAGHLANEALIHQIRASDQWAYYQSKSIKGYLLETQVALLPNSELGRAAHHKLATYEDEKAHIKGEAEALEKEAGRELDRHSRFATVVTILQVAIALSAIAALARVKSVWFASLAMAAWGIATFAMAYRP